jgi:hypothetical protein
MYFDMKFLKKLFIEVLNVLIFELTYVDIYTE